MQNILDRGNEKLTGLDLDKMMMDQENEIAGMGKRLGEMKDAVVYFG